MTETVSQQKQQIVALEKLIDNAQSQRVEDQERDDLFKMFKNLEEEARILTEEVKKFEKYDKKRLEILSKEKNNVVGFVNKTTDDIFAVKHWIKKQFPSISEEEINLQFEIPPDLDTI